MAIVVFQEYGSTATFLPEVTSEKQKLPPALPG
jgi:hypothetical protein